MILLDPDLDPDPASEERRRSDGGRTQSTEQIADKPAAHQRVPSTAALARFLTQAQGAVRLRGRVSVLLTTDKSIRRLNRQFRGIDKATDVLSFPADTAFPGKEKIAGDLAISVPTARRQAAACGHTLAIELKVLILHGLLHLAGYDHEIDSGQMARRERALRAKLGLPQGLIERAHEVPAKKAPRRTGAGVVRGERR
jgi:probable rRNA maturation factor